MTNLTKIKIDGGYTSSSTIYVVTTMPIYTLYSSLVSTSIYSTRLTAIFLLLNPECITCVIFH
jgi:hypothetical protein